MIVNRSDLRGDSGHGGHDGQQTPVDVQLMARTVHEIVEDMNLGACAETITQTIQILELGNGKKAAIQITVTTDPDSYM